MANRKRLPPSYLFAAIALMVLLHLLLPIIRVIYYPWQFIGIVPLLIGVVLNLIADRSFKTFNTTVKPFKESTALITTGVFSISRHPMYLGMIFILLGIAIIIGTLSPFFIIPVFVVVMGKIFIEVEERMLAEKFGDKWVEYTSRVRRWI